MTSAYKVVRVDVAYSYKKEQGNLLIHHCFGTQTISLLPFALGGDSTPLASSCSMMLAERLYPI